MNKVAKFMKNAQLNYLSFVKSGQISQIRSHGIIEYASEINTL